MEEFLAWVIDKLWMIIVASFIWIGKILWSKPDRVKEDLSVVTERLAERVITLEKQIIIQESINNKFVTNAELKDAIHEILEPYKQESKELKQLLRELNTHIYELGRELAVQSALRNSDLKQKKQD